MPFDGTPERYEDQMLDVLLRARELVKAGWTKYFPVQTYDDGSTRYCLRGAIYTAMGVKYFVNTTYKDRQMEREIVNLLRIPKKIEQWNDMPWRTKGSVLRALDRAIARRRLELAFTKQTEGAMP